MAVNVLLLINLITTPYGRSAVCENAWNYLGNRTGFCKIQYVILLRFSVYVNFVWNRTKVTDIIRNNLVYVHTYVHINALYTYAPTVEMKYYLLLPGTMAVINP